MSSTTTRLQRGLYKVRNTNVFLLHHSWKTKNNWSLLVDVGPKMHTVRTGHRKRDLLCWLELSHKFGFDKDNLILREVNKKKAITWIPCNLS